MSQLVEEGITGAIPSKYGLLTLKAPENPKGLGDMAL